MPIVNFITLIFVAIFAAALAYKISFLRNKTIGRFSLHQIIYLIIIPGFVYTFFFAYIQSVLDRPSSFPQIAPDGLLVNSTLLFALFTYGGVAIHSTSKMLSETLVNQPGSAKELNKYFHMSFSHNLAFSGGIATMIGATLLELNHPSPHSSNNILLAIIKGVILGLSLVFAMLWYTSPKIEEHLGRWSDLKTTFLIFWICVVILLYGIKKTNPIFREFDLLLPMLAAFSVIGSLNMILIYRKLKRGGFKLYFKLGKIKRLLFETKF